MCSICGSNGFKKTCEGFAELTRFADDFVATFRNQGDADRFRREMEERLAAFGLRIAPEKTAVRHFDGSLLQGGHGSTPTRPETFTFLGFVHFQTVTRRGAVSIQRKPSVKARERFVSKAKLWLRVNSASSDPTGASEGDAAGLLSVLRALLLHARTPRRAEPSREVLARRPAEVQQRKGSRATVPGEQAAGARQRDSTRTYGA